MQKIEHVFFDLDHTLWDFEKNSALTFEKIFTEINFSVDISSFLSYYKPINLDLWRLYREDKISKQELRYQRLKTTFDNMNLNISDDAINQLSVLYIENLPTFNHLFDGTKEVLDYLACNYTLHIITNGFEEVQHVKLRESRILPYFKQIVTSESVGVKKPNPLVFEYALQQSGATISNSVMIGDSFEADILGAHAVGMDVIFCNFEQEKIENNIFKTVNKLVDLKKFL